MLDFTKEEREFIKTSMENSTARGIDSMRLIISIVEKCDKAAEEDTQEIDKK